MRVAGLAPVMVPGVENIDVTELVPGHMAYRAAMPKLLREVGWMVESDEFTEIEDPDPENHEKRQRELINEIEEARKELEEKQKSEKKSAFNFFRKKKSEKKGWEVYDEKSQSGAIDKDADPAKIAENPVLFDLDAIKQEVEALSADGIEIKEIKSTLPPMKIDMAATSPNPYSNLRETKSYNDSLGVAPTSTNVSSANLSVYSNGAHSSHNGDQEKSVKGDDPFADENAVTMTFDTSFNEAPPPPKSPLPPATKTPPVAKDPGDPPPANGSPVPDRPPLKSSATAPNPSDVNLAPGYNAWTDEFDDEFGKEKEMKMTFE